MVPLFEGEGELELLLVPPCSSSDLERVAGTRRWMCSGAVDPERGRRGEVPTAVGGSRVARERSRTEVVVGSMVAR